ncbi:diguanylate cyclase [Nitrincola iocasae]|uniref:diguanylate cyclase n=1 Tax=Nitrincola iocasae TaxID=2614693 RepID=A0A5J6LGP6_9GAMM|nr:diguanylate cyclase [Nitrincola iocasae]QEW07767.1 diguanylate cyclase [Nitrincola iocasae]
MHKLQTKIIFALSSVMLLLTLVITVASLASFRDFSIRAATEHTRTAAEVIRVALTEAMLNGTIDKRDSLLGRIANVNGLDEARVIRGPQVKQQFGDGLLGEMTADTTDLNVLSSGESVFTLNGGILSPEFRATIPYIATSDGDVNCLLCHNVPENTVLGAVTLTASIEHMKSAAIMTVAFLVIAVGLFAFISILYLRRMLHPLVTTANEIETAVESAIAGDFSHRIESRTNDEIGKIATQFNALSEGITNKLSLIRENVVQLVQSKPDYHGGNLLTETAETVSGLVRVSRFKQAIEEDETAGEVFLRISEVLEQEFNIHTFSLYEVEQNKKMIHPVMIDGVPEAPIHWCDPAIHDHCVGCRAVRTGHLIDGSENTQICRSFSIDAAATNKHYICLPVIESGSVGSVVQLVFDVAEAHKVRNQRPLLEAYLREAAPVLQAKRLMASLRESSLKDAMTGLRNRRFLEEYAETLISQCKRRSVPMTLLMMDLDYFKPVNDTYGHDAGDQVLRELAVILQANVRESDLVVRYGGEEFLIVLLETNAEQAMPVAEKIRGAVESHKFKVGGTSLSKTISAGVADYPNDAQAFWQVLKFADVSLYAAKEGGRNQVVRFHKELWSEDADY